MSQIEPPFRERRTMLDRFVERIRSGFQFFQPKVSESQISLSGRIQDLQKTAVTILQQLITIKEELKNAVDSELFTFVEAVVNPLIRDVERIQKSVEEEGSIVKQAQAFKRYNEWIEKAKTWVQVCSKPGDPKRISRAVIRLTIDEFLEVIDRDLQVIHGYTEHMIDNLSLDDEDKIHLVQELNFKLDPYIQSLKILKTRPMELHLSHIQEWKIKVDKRREKYFDGALHAIDKIIAEMNPNANSEEEHEHLVDVITQIVYLEEEVPQLCEEIFQIDSKDSFQKEILLVRLSSLQKEFHNLNLDLRLTPELIDRLQIVVEMLEKAQNLLSN